MSTDLDLARTIDEVSRLVGTFTLRSGATATEYFDKYQFESDPVILRAIAKSLVSLVPKEIEVLAGLELGGIPVVTALSFETGLPATFVRKTAKTYGTERLAEGPDVSGRHVLIVEDVVTSGGQILLSTSDLRDLGAIVDHALCVVDREQGGVESLHGAAIELHSLFRRSDLDEAQCNR